MKTPLLSLALYCGLTLLAAGNTFPIDFSQAGYNPGQLNGQGSGGTRWLPLAGEASIFVTDGVGQGGKPALLTAASSDPTRQDQSYLFPTTEEDLPGFNGEASVVEFSFRFRLNGPVSGNKPSSNAIFRIGHDRQLRGGGAWIGFTHNGTITYKNGDKLIPVKNASGKPLTLSDTDTVVEIRGQLNYADKTWALFVDDVPQGDNSLAFEVPTTSCALQIINVFKKDETYIPMVFDAFSLSVKAGTSD